MCKNDKWFVVFRYRFKELKMFLNIDWRFARIFHYWNEAKSRVRINFSHTDVTAINYMMQ